MKGLKLLSVLLCVTFLVSSIAFAVVAETGEIEASYADGELTIDVYVSELASEDVESIDAEVVIDDELFEIDAEGDYTATVSGYEGADAVVTADGTSLEIAIDAFDFAVTEKTKVLTVTLPVKYVGLDAEITESVIFSSVALDVEELTCDVEVEAENKIEAEIELAAEMTAYDTVSIKLVAEGADDVALDVDDEASTDDKIVTVAVNGEASEFTATNYKLVVSADGYLTDESTSFAVASGKSITIEEFLPGDVNADNKINIYDFNALCSYLVEGNDYEEDTKCDLDKDGDIDETDVECLLAGFNGGAN